MYKSICAIYINAYIHIFENPVIKANCKVLKGPGDMNWRKRSLKKE